MPPSNPQRRRDLTDAAIALLASRGVHGVTHRAVEQAADVPPGTASNYFRSREALLVATAERVLELHFADMDRAAEQHGDASARGTGRRESSPQAMAELVVDLLADSLLEAATGLRNRYLAIFELQLEAQRRPALAAAIEPLAEESKRFTAQHHAQLGLPIAVDRIPTLITLYQGALFALIGGSRADVSADTVHEIARVIVRGTLPDWIDTAADGRHARNRVR